MRWETILPTDQGQSGRPTPREAHSATLVNGNTIYVFGGYDGKWLNDMYTLSVPSWKWKKVQYESPASSIPRARSGHTMHFIPDKNTLLLFGGFNGDRNCYFNDVHIFDIEKNTWQEMKCTGEMPHSREAHTSAYLDTSNTLFIYAGYGRKQLGDCYILSLDDQTWSEVVVTMKGERSRNSKLERSKHSMAFLPDKQQLLVMGGDGGGGSTGAGMDTSLNDVLKFDIETMEWTAVEIDQASLIPEPRNGHCLVSIQDHNEPRFVLWGGTDGATTYFSELYELDLTSRKWTKLEPETINAGLIPQGRENHSFTVVKHPKHVAVMFGGCLGVDYSNDLCILDLDTCASTPKKGTKPSKACSLQ